MCSIWGGVFNKRKVKQGIIERLSLAGMDRGRDGQGWAPMAMKDGMVACVGASRAAPTTEAKDGPRQPYDGIVHNGTIANDVELNDGVKLPIDSMVLPKVLVRDKGLADFAESVTLLKGSFAIACLAPDTIYLARNYKPIYYAEIEEGTVFSSMARHFKGLTEWGHAPVQMEPYSVLDLRSGGRLPLPRRYLPRAVVVASSGLDSTTAAAMLLRDGYEVCLLHFTYGCQAESRELEAIRRIAAALGCKVAVVPMPAWGGTICDPNGVIVGGMEGAEFAKEWVPARNLMFMGVAVAFAEGNGYHAVAMGNNLEEAGAYPDNEEEMTELLEHVMPYSVADGYEMHVLSPVGRMMKHEIVKEGLEMGVPYELTWSCYKDGPKPCRDCGPCFMREEAFRRNGTVDPLVSA